MIILLKDEAELLRHLESERVPVALYGAGKYGRIALENIRRDFPNMRVICFLDDNLLRNDSDVENLPVLSLQDRPADCQIILSNYYVRETMRNIAREGIDLSKVFFSNKLLVDRLPASQVKGRETQFREVYASLSDYESKIIYKTMVECRLNGNIDILSRTCQDLQYFPSDIFTYSDNEIFIDGGAFDGDTIDSFKGVTSEKFKYIYAFEPDENNYARLLANQGKDERILCINKGLHRQDGELSFSSGKGGSSTISDKGVDVIKTCCFDCLDVPDRSVTFVKMDIEGSELLALQGMEGTIRENKPKLAICIYHKFSDLWEIPLFIKSIVPEYKFYIRNYTTYLDEIVLYAKA